MSLLKIIIQSFIISIVIHLIYIVGTLILGYVKTKNYKPDIANRWGKVETLQNEVAFGTVGSPVFFLFTFIGITLISLLSINTYRKIHGLK